MLKNGYDLRCFRLALAAGGAGVLLAYGYGTARARRRARTGIVFPDAPQPGSTEFARLAEVVTGSPVRPGNRVQVLHNGCQTFPAMLEAIASAQTTVDLSSYIYWPGDIAAQFTSALAAKAKAGVEVNVLFDGWGSAPLTDDTVTTLRRAGASVAFFRPPRWYTLHKLNNRMHRRLLIVDGVVAFAGGVGIADVWTGDADDPDHWRETHMAIQGPAVRYILGGFLENWAETTGAVLGPKHFPSLAAFEDGIDVHATRSSPRGGSTAASQVFQAAMAGARDRLWITTAYFAPGPAFVDALCHAAARNVDVRILVNGPHIDKQVVRRAGQHCYSQLLNSSVRIFEYQQTMLHAKVFIADGWATIGSCNLDHRSLVLDDEVNVATSNLETTAELAKQFLRDLDVSQEIDAGSWNNRPPTRRVSEFIGETLRQSL